MKFTVPKKKIVIISASTVLVLAIITVTVACLNMGGRSRDDNAIDVLGDPDISVETESPGNTQTPESSTPTTAESPVVTLPKDESGFVYNDTGNGTCMLVAIGSCEKTDLKIPSKNPKGLTVTAIATGAFEGCSKIKSISIPSTVTKIGTGAFVGCSSLSCFYVDSTNTEYCVVGNVLFSKDKTEMICYPAKRVGANYLLSTNVTKIAAYAFDGVTSLQKLLYSGSINQYLGIEVGTGNSVFTNMPIEFNYNGQKP